jgi:sulfoxide reductase heme-binding subunit YedZ
LVRDVWQQNPSPTDVGRFFEKLVGNKFFALICIILPGLWPAWTLFIQARPAILADPGEYILHHLGFTTCVLLAIVLTFSPLRAIAPKWRITRALNRHRRLAGVSVFVYGALHFTMYLIHEGGFGTLATDWHKPFILAGLTTLGILAVLAATSTNAAVRTLGGRRWKWLHRLVYIAAALAIYHQISARKVFPMQVVWIFGPLVLLQIARVVKNLTASRRPPRTGSRPAAGQVSPGGQAQ